MKAILKRSELVVQSHISRVRVEQENNEEISMEDLLHALFFICIRIALIPSAKKRDLVKYIYINFGCVFRMDLDILSLFRPDYLIHWS